MIKHGFDIGHMVVNSVVHGVVYASIYKVMRGMSSVEVVGLSVLVCGGLFWFLGRRIKSHD